MRRKTWHGMIHVEAHGRSYALGQGETCNLVDDGGDLICTLEAVAPQHVRVHLGNSYWEARDASSPRCQPKCQFCVSNEMHRKWYPEMYPKDDDDA